MTEHVAGFRVDVVTMPEGPVLRPHGDLDLLTADDLVSVAWPLIAAPPAVLTIDMSGVDFCDSAGINALVRLRNRCDAAAWQLTVRSPQAHVRHVFELSGLNEFLSVSPA
jgi:anti-anti-sigma factor